MRRHTRQEPSPEIKTEKSNVQRWHWQPQYTGSNLFPPWLLSGCAVSVWRGVPWIFSSGCVFFFPSASHPPHLSTSIWTFKKKGRHKIRIAAVSSHQKFSFHYLYNSFGTIFILTWRKGYASGLALVPVLGVIQQPRIWIPELQLQQYYRRGAVPAAPPPRPLLLPGCMSSNGRFALVDEPRSRRIVVGTSSDSRFIFPVETFYELGATYGNWRSEF